MIIYDEGDTSNDLSHITDLSPLLPVAYDLMEWGSLHAFALKRMAKEGPGFPDIAYPEDDRMEGC